MVCLFGMSDQVGPVLYPQGHGEFAYSQATAEKIDAEVRSLAHGAYERAKAIITQKREMLDKLAHALLERETLQAGEVYELLGVAPRTEHTFS